MTREDKKLLLQDLSARLMYGVKYSDALNTEEQIFTLGTIVEYGLVMDTYGFSLEIEDVKPYLFPLSSMTDEQIMQSPTSVHVCDLENLRYDSVWTELNSRFTDLIDLIDWLNKNHFDYRGLIEKGLAIDATGKNIY